VEKIASAVGTGEFSNTLSDACSGASRLHCRFWVPLPEADH